MMTTAAESPGNPTGKNLALKFLGPLFVILLLVVGGLWIVKRQATGGASATAQLPVTAGDQGASGDDRLPDIALQELGGSPKHLSELKKKVVMINFWATWCEACMVEMPSIVRLRNAYKDKGFDVVAINVDEDQKVVPAALKKLGIDFPVYTDPTGSLADRFDIHAIPVSVFITGERKVLLAYNGERDWNSGEVHQVLEQWLAPAEAAEGKK